MDKTLFGYENIQNYINTFKAILECILKRILKQQEIFQPTNDPIGSLLCGIIIFSDFLPSQQGKRGGTDYYFLL